METLILKDLVNNSGSNAEGSVLYDSLKDAFYKDQNLVLLIDPDMALSSSFLNSSIGQFLDQFGLENFKRIVKLRSTENQFRRIADYVKDYQKLYLQ